jgi:hypothetical protein
VNWQEGKMKATLEFDLSTEESNFKEAINGTTYLCALTELDERLRGYLKYGHKFKSINEAIEDIRTELRQDMRDRDISFGD